MNRVNTPQRFSWPLASGALLGVTALAASGGCNRQSTELQALDAKALAAPPPPKPPMPGGAPSNVAPPPATLPAFVPPGTNPATSPGTTLPTAPPPARLPPMNAPAATASAATAAPAATAASAATAAPAMAAAAPTPAPTAPYGNAATQEKPKVAMVLATPAGVAPILVPGTMALKAQLKTLWNRGAAAKHRGDIAGARKAWLAARRLAPQWPGFQESLDKLDK